jgi:hypothetical protein
MFGDNARHVPGWLYVQDAGGGIVTFAGSSRMTHPHPLRYGSNRAHQFVVGELIIRPHIVVTTDSLQGEGLTGLVTGAHDIGEMLVAGEVVLGSMSQVADLRR